MQTVELQVGAYYARRARPDDDSLPVDKVKLVAPPRAGQAKVLYKTGQLVGLKEWVKTRSLLCGWDEREAFVRDERHERIMREQDDAHRDLVVEEAISAVLIATGEETGFSRSWTLPPERAHRLWRRAGLVGRPDDRALCYTDRQGQLHLGYGTALEFAQAFAAAESESCLSMLAEWDQAYRSKGYEPGERHWHDALRQAQPAHALVRAWAGRGDQDFLRDELQRLRALLQRAINDLDRCGQTGPAGSLRRALDGS